MTSNGTYEPNFPVYVHDVVDYSDMPHINADYNVAKVFEEQHTPSSKEVVEADVFFTALINYMNKKLSQIRGQSNLSIALFIINRAFECKKWLLKNFFKFSQLFYFPTRPNNLMIPPIYPHHEPPTINSLPASDISQTTIDLLLIQSRVLAFIITMSRTNDLSNPEILNKDRATQYSLDLDVFNPADIYEKLVC